MCILMLLSHRRYLIEMFAGHSQIPCFISFLSIIRKPACHNSELLLRERTCRKLTVNQDDGLIFVVIREREVYCALNIM